MTRQRLICYLAIGAVVSGVAWSGQQHLRAQRWRAQESESVRMLGVMRSRALSEVSGLALASGEPLQLWAHNDSGDSTRIFRIAGDGQLLDEFQLEGAAHRDWEDICSFSRAGERYLLVGDVGDNSTQRESCQLYLLSEPKSNTSSEAVPPRKQAVSSRRIEFRYEDGPRNCEALAFDTSSDSLLLVEKLLGSAPEQTQAGVYQLSLQPLLDNRSSSADQPLVAQRIGDLPWRNVTGLDLSADGRKLFIRTYFEGYLLERGSDETWATRLKGQLPQALQLPVEAQGEAVCFSADAKAVLLTSEFVFQPIWRLELPAADRALESGASTNELKTAEANTQDQQVKQLILPGESFECAGRPAFILWPKAELRREPQPWIFYAPTLPPYPDEAEKWMHQQFLDAGVAVAGIDVGEAYGAPQAREKFELFYAELTEKRGLAKRPCLLGRSRGGLWVSSWAADHPERFAGLAGIYPVFDWRTYPGVNQAAPAYGLSAEELEQRAAELNPISRIDRLAKARLPVFLIHGDVDTVVPLKENSAAFAEAYRREGAEAAIELVIPKGQGHNMWEGFFRCQELVDFAIARAKSGAESSVK